MTSQPSRDLPRLSVLMPVYNESRTLRTIVDRVLKAEVGMDIELVCVDDGSSDGSREILAELASADDRIKVIEQPRNMGKGMAIRTAIGEMTGDFAIIQDADLEYDPADYSRVLQPLVDRRADVVYGSRFAASEQRRVLFFWHSLGNRLLTTLSNMANDLNLTDMETCYKAFRADLLKSLRLTSSRFGFEPEVTARIAQWGARIYEVPISYHGRTYAEGKTIGWRDGLEALWLIFKFRFVDTRATDDRSVVTKQSLHRARRTARWTLTRFDGFIGDEILEVGGGPGHLTSHLLDRRRLVVIDSEMAHIETLRRRFGHMENFHAVAGPLDDLTSQSFDTALVFEDLQRVPDPTDFMRRVADQVKPGGHVLIRVPAHQGLFGAADEAAGHRRRFSRSELEEVVLDSGLRLKSVEEFNRVGAWAWTLHHNLSKTSITATEAWLFDLLVPVWRLIEKIGPLRGLSFLAVAQVD